MIALPRRTAALTASAVAHSLASTVIYDVVLAPFVVPLIAIAVRRAEPAA